MRGLQAHHGSQGGMLPQRPQARRRVRETNVPVASEEGADLPVLRLDVAVGWQAWCGLGVQSNGQSLPAAQCQCNNGAPVDQPNYDSQDEAGISKTGLTGNPGPAHAD